MVRRDTHRQHRAAHFAFRQPIDNPREQSLKKPLLAWIRPLHSRHDVHLPDLLPYCDSPTLACVTQIVWNHSSHDARRPTVSFRLSTSRISAFRLSPSAFSKATSS